MYLLQRLPLLSYSSIIQHSSLDVQTTLALLFLQPACVQLEIMLRRQSCVSNLMSWAPEGRGKALEVLMCALSGRGLHRRATRAVINWEICKVTCELGPQTS